METSGRASHVLWGLQLLLLLLVVQSATTVKDTPFLVVPENRQAPSLCPRCRCGVPGGVLRAPVIDAGVATGIVDANANGDGGGGGEGGGGGGGGVVEASVARRRRRRRFVGGEQVRPGRFPWLAAVHRLPPYEGVTTGALISDRHVITANSAIDRVPPQNLRVTVGASALCGLSNGLNVSVASVRAFPGSESPGDDIAILRLANAVTFNPLLRPVCLPPSDRSTFAGRVATLVSFGGNATDALTPDATEAPSTPGAATPAPAPAPANGTRLTFRWRCRPTALLLPVLRPGDCAAAGGAPGCVGTPGAPSLVCPSDTGGLVQILGARQEVQLIGLLSGSNSCNASETGPSTFARTAPRLAWILRQTSDGCFCPAPS